MAKGEAVLVALTRVRKVHSLATAAKETGLSHPLLLKHLKALGTAPLSGSTSLAKWVLDADKLASISNKVRRLVIFKSVQNELEATDLQLELLLEENLLIPAVDSSDIAAVWDIQVIRSQLEKWISAAEDVPEGSATWERSLKTRIRCRVSLSEILEVISEGQLRTGLLEGQHRLSHLLLHRNDLDRLFPGGMLQAELDDETLSNSTSLSECGRRLGLRNHEDLLALVQDGHLLATQMLNPRNNNLLLRVSELHALLFHEKFIVLSAIAKTRKQHANAVRVLLQQESVSEFSDGGKQCGPIYDRLTVEHML